MKTAADILGEARALCASVVVFGPDQTEPSLPKLVRELADALEREMAGAAAMRDALIQISDRGCGNVHDGLPSCIDHNADPKQRVTPCSECMATQALSSDAGHDFIARLRAAVAETAETWGKLVDAREAHHERVQERDAARALSAEAAKVLRCCEESMPARRLPELRELVKRLEKETKT